MTDHEEIAGVDAPAPAGEYARSAAGRAEQTAWQRRAVGALGKILERAGAEGLPPIAWTVETAGARLNASCRAPRMAARRDD